MSQELIQTVDELERIRETYSSRDEDGKKSISRKDNTLTLQEVIRSTDFFTWIDMNLSAILIGKIWPQYEWTMSPDGVHHMYRRWEKIRKAPAFFNGLDPENKSVLFSYYRKYHSNK